MKEPISITLSERAIKVLDEFSNISSFESRSQMVEEVILALSQIVNTYIRIRNTAQEKFGKKSIDQNLGMSFMNQVDVVLDRLGLLNYIEKNAKELGLKK